MPVLPDKVFELEKTVMRLTKKLEAAERKIAGIEGSFLVQGYVGKKLTLNASLNAIELLKRLQEVAVTAETARSSSAAGLSESITALASSLAELTVGLSSGKVPLFNGSVFVNSAVTEGTGVVVSKQLATAGRKRATAYITTTSYQILVSDEEVSFNTDTGDKIAVLPEGVGGMHYRIINCGSSGNDVHVQPFGTEKLDGVAGEKLLGDGDVVDLTYETNTGWR